MESNKASITDKIIIAKRYIHYNKTKTIFDPDYSCVCTTNELCPVHPEIYLNKAEHLLSGLKAKILKEKSRV